MSYNVALTKEASEQINMLKKSGKKNVLSKIIRIFDELELHPTTGTGKPERLKGQSFDIWSRRLTKKDRIVYRIDGDKIIVYVLSVMGHYDDK